ncbi:MAG: hypothetical protein HYT83_00030 [Candidatus Levybacteria bacterium]|nr:hypothetical protein [Candidatus Levybacteria bacterium]
MSRQEAPRTQSDPAAEHQRWLAVRRGNADSSMGPGMTVYVTPGGRDQLERVAQECGYDGLNTRPVAEGIVAIDYPNGVYGTGLGGVELWQHAVSSNDDKSEWNTRSMPTSMPCYLVIRIEGSSGEHWQNVDYPELAETIQRAKEQQPTQ